MNSVDDRGVAAQIARLYELHQSGALSDSEFESAKQRVLGEATSPIDEREADTKQRTALQKVVGGCLVIPLGIVALIVTGLVATAIFGDGGGSSGGGTVALNLTVDVNSGMSENWVLGGTGCDHPDYTIEISSSNRVGSGRVADIPLTGGTMVENVFCRYVVNIDAPRHEKYWVRVTTHVGDVTVLAKTIEVPATANTFSADLRWYHPRDN